MCVGQTSTICEDVREGKVAPLVHDRRIKALVIADLLSVFFTKTLTRCGFRFSSGVPSVSVTG